jgi:Tfp pilus assembly protein PilO
MPSSARLIASILVIAVLAIAFWMLALSPKREKADELSQQINQLGVTLAETEGAASEAEAARRDFPTDYRQLVVLGQAVPAGDETSSLLVELETIAVKSKVSFEGIQLDSSGEAASAPVPVPEVSPSATASEGTNAVPASESVPPTEMAASLLPLGASIGPAGLAVMPYSLTFKGDFAHIADLIGEIDSLVRTSGSNVSVDGRLLTLSSFNLTEDSDRGFPYLEAAFTVTSYVTPPSQGVTAGANPSAPAAVPAPEGETAEPSTTSETVSAR